MDGHGCADMINFRDEEGRLALPINLLEKQSLRRQIRSELSMFGTTGFVPFSSMHRYQRKDSIWAQEHVVPPPQYRSISRKLMTAPPEGGGEVFPAFIRYCCKSDAFEELRPCPTTPVVYEPEHFGDNWADELDKDDAQDAARYFKAVEHLRRAYDFVNLRVGGRVNFLLGEFSLRCKNLHRPGSTVHRIMKAGFYFGLGRR